MFVILGDHGVREANIMKNRPENDAFGDELFKTTAILYSPSLGHHYFPHHVDSDDIAWTLFDMLDDQPSARFGSQVLKLEHNPRVRMHYTHILSEFIVKESRSRINSFKGNQNFLFVRNFYRHLHYANGYFHKGFFCESNCAFPTADPFRPDNQVLVELSVVLCIGVAVGVLLEVLALLKRMVQKKLKSRGKFGKVAKLSSAMKCAKVDQSEEISEAIVITISPSTQIV